jgi:hypothetical protein
LARLRRVRSYDLALLFAALAEVIRTRLALTLRRTAQIRRAISVDLDSGKRRSGSGLTAKDLHKNHAEVAWSVKAAARLVPRATCLTQAFSAQRLLARRGVDVAVHLTVPKDASDGFLPHAWVMGDGVILLGGTARDYVAHTWLLDYLADGSTISAGKRSAPAAATGRMASP